MWKKLGYLDRVNIKKFQKRTVEFIIPHDAGRIF